MEAISSVNLIRRLLKILQDQTNKRRIGLGHVSDQDHNINISEEPICDLGINIIDLGISKIKESHDLVTKFRS